MKWALGIALVSVVGAGLLYLYFHGNGTLVLGSDELHPARALVGDDWSVTEYPPDPEESAREYYRNWPIQFPPLFGLLTRTSVALLGVSHFALRLFPAVFALAAVVCSYYLFSLFFRRELAFVAAAIMGMASDKFVIYAKSLKHYSADVLIAVFLLLVGKLLTERDDRKYWVALTVIATIGVWVAFASVFVSAGIFLVLLLQRVLLKNRDGSRFWVKFFLSGSLVGLSFFGVYSINIARATGNPVFIREWLVQIFDWSRVTDVHYVFQYVSHVILHIGLLPKYFFNGSTLIMVVANTFVLAWVCFGIKGKRWIDLLLMLLPLILVVGASLCGSYPFSAGRLTLFLLPSWLLMIVCGFVDLTQRLPMADRFRAVVVPLGLVVLFLTPLRHNFGILDIQEYGGGRRVDLMMQALKDNAQDGDAVFLHWGAISAFYFYFTDHGAGYAKRYPIRRENGSVFVIYGPEYTFNPDAHESTFHRVESLPGRVWLVFGHLWPSEDMLAIKTRLEGKHTRIDSWEFKGCELLLYASLEENSINESLLVLTEGARP